MNALRKKIEMASGLPPRLAGATAFWGALQEVVGDWASALFGEVGKITISGRQIVDTADLGEQAKAPFVFLFDLSSDASLLGVRVNKYTAFRYAQVRLEQGAETLDAASDLFLKLLFEATANELGAAVLARIDSRSDPTLGLLSEPLASLHDRPSIQKYLQVDFVIDVAGGDAAVTLFLSLETVMHAVARPARPAASADDHALDAFERQVRSSSLVLDVVLEHMSTTIGACARLEPGQVLALGDVDTNNLAVEADAIGARVSIARGELGIWNSQRAIKVQAVSLDRFAAEAQAL